MRLGTYLTGHTCMICTYNSRHLAELEPPPPPPPTDLLQIHWPDRYVPLFGATAYDVKLERKDSVPFEEQLMGLEEVVRSGKVGPAQSNSTADRTR